jgi:RNA polymerase sigma factor (sigma-70 family)
MTKDYAIQIKIKNNRILQRMKMAGIESAAELERRAGLGPGTAGRFLNFKESGLTANEEWRGPIIKIADALKCLPEDLIPEQHLRSPLAKNTGMIEASPDEIDALITSRTSDPEKGIANEEAKKLINECLHTLPARIQRVLELRFGLHNNEEHTLEAVGQQFGITGQRVRDIEAQGLRMLKSKTRRKKLLAAFDAITNGDHDRSYDWEKKRHMPPIRFEDEVQAEIEVQNKISAELFQLDKEIAEIRAQLELDWEIGR